MTEQSMSEQEKIEISDIRLELNKLFESGVLSRDTAEACSQAASLLIEMRRMILSGRDSDDIVRELRELLARQGEG